MLSPYYTINTLCTFYNICNDWNALSHNSMAVAAGRYVRVGDLVWVGIQIGNCFFHI